MSKRIFMALLPLVILLTSCAGKTPAATNAPAATGSSPTASATVAAKPTNTLSLATATSQPATTSPVAKEPGCTVVSPQPTPGPTQESLFPSKTSYDFSRGSEDASVTIIVYSDFQ